MKLDLKKFLNNISIHFNCSFMQLKQQSSSHNNTWSVIASIVMDPVHNIPELSACYHKPYKYILVACFSQNCLQRFARFVNNSEENQLFVVKAHFHIYINKVQGVNIVDANLNMTSEPYRYMERK